MARYIDADKLNDKLEELEFNSPVMTPIMKIYNVIGLVEDQPTAEVVEVKHGEWIYFYDTKGIKRCKCSECITSYGCLDTPYCPSCGAKMEGGKTE